MKNIEKANPFKSIIRETDFGKFTILITAVGVSTQDSISIGEKTLLANYVYDEDDGYDLVYTIVDVNGNSESFVESEGILPTLFLSPSQDNYVSICPYHPDKELEISIPVFNRENTEMPKGNRPFVGKFVGISNQFSIFHDADMWSDAKPDKLLAIEFKSNALKKKHNSKIGLPRNNKVFIVNNEIHLLAADGNGWLHRLIDEKGRVIQERYIHLNQKYFWQILKLSFEETSYILCEKEGKILIEVVAPDNSCKTTELIGVGDRFYNVWQPIRIANDTYTVHFNGELGNGWFTVKCDRLLELFYSNGVNGYKNLLTNEVLTMDYESLVIASINNTTDNGYAIVFYPRTEESVQNKEIIVLNRQLMS